jgi:hypothetical protein
MADLSKILQKESEGIMFPFRTGVQSTTTEQQVYDSATDGIMTVTGQQYTLPEYKGPTATVQYGTEKQGYPRMLREIEQGELPQFRQENFPEVGTGIMQTSTPVTQPVDTTPTTEPEAPAYDPCPPGFKYDPIQKVCVPIEQPRSDRQEITLPEPKSLTNQARDLKGTINFDKDISATDPNLREGQYEYQPSRKTLNPFETGGIIGTIMNGLHNIGQDFNEKQAMDLGILRDNNGDGKPDTIDTVQVTRNYQEEELGLPPGARATGAELSMEKGTQYNTIKKIYEEGQVQGTKPTEVKPVVEKVEEEVKVDTPTFNILENNAKQFGFLSPLEYGQLFRDLEVQQKLIKNTQEMLDTGVMDKSLVSNYMQNMDKAEREADRLRKKIQSEKEKRIKVGSERLQSAGASKEASESVYRAMENTKARDDAQQAYQKAQKEDRGQSASERQQEAQRRTQSVKKDISTGQRIRGGI